MKILILDDNVNDVALLKDAFALCGVTDPLYFVKNAEEAIGYLTGQGIYQSRNEHPLPSLLLIDLKLPNASGLELLKWFQENPKHRVVPTIVLTSSLDETEITQAYNLSANTYFLKPSSHLQLCALVKVIYDYWSVARVPEHR